MIQGKQTGPHEWRQTDAFTTIMSAHFPSIASKRLGIDKDRMITIRYPVLMMQVNQAQSLGQCGLCPPPPIKSANFLRVETWIPFDICHPGITASFQKARELKQGAKTLPTEPMQSSKPQTFSATRTRFVHNPETFFHFEHTNRPRAVMWIGQIELSRDDAI